MYNYQNTNIVSLYKDLQKINVLTKEEERALFVLIREGNIAARKKVIKSNVRFILSVALQYRAAPIPVQDLISEGTFGLIKAIDKFDHTRGLRFLSYAVWWIRAFMSKAIIEKGFMVRLPGNKFEQVNSKFKKENSQIRVRDEVHLILKSYEQNIKADLGDNIEMPDTTTNHTSDIDNLNKSLAELSERDQLVMRKLFALDGSGYRTLTSVAEEFCMSQEAIRKIRNKSLDKMRKVMEKSCRTI